MIALIISLAVVHLLGVMSPGPDFAMTSRNSLVYGRRAGLLTAVGITAGNFFHISYVTAGFAILLAGNHLLYYFVMLAGGAYLLFFAVICVKNFFVKDVLTETSLVSKSSGHFFLSGLITNVTNPKCALYYIAIASKFMAPSVSPYGKILFAGEMVFITGLWFCFVAFVLTDSRLRSAFADKRRYIDICFGVIITALASVMIYDSLKGFCLLF